MDIHYRRQCLAFIKLHGSRKGRATMLLELLGPIRTVATGTTWFVEVTTRGRTSLLQVHSGTSFLVFINVLTTVF